MKEKTCQTTAKALFLREALEVADREELEAWAQVEIATDAAEAKSAKSKMLRNWYNQFGVDKDAIEQAITKAGEP